MGDSNHSTGTRRLQRSTDDRLLAGVAGGLGQYLHVDPLIVRIAIIIVAIFQPVAMVVAYVAGWFIIPEAGGDGSQQPDVSSGNVQSAADAPADATEPHARGPANTDTGRGRWYAGIALVVCGVVLLINELLPTSDDVVLALLMIGGGIMLVIQGVRRP